MHLAGLNFQFDKPYDEVTINDEQYKLYYDDESLKEYQKQATTYEKKSKAHLEKLQKDLTDEQREKLEKEGMEFIREFVETFYGEGAYEKLYEASGKAMINFMPLVEFTFDWLQKKVPDVDQSKKEYYTKK